MSLTSVHSETTHIPLIVTAKNKTQKVNNFGIICCFTFKSYSCRIISCIIASIAKISSSKRAVVTADSQHEVIISII